MKKLLFILTLSLISVSNLFAIEVVKKGKLSLDIYGDIYGDFFYNKTFGVFGDVDANLEPYEKEGFFNPLLVGDNHDRFIGVNALMGSSLLGVDLTIGRTRGTIEFGVKDTFRKVILQRDFNKENEHYLMLGKDNILAYYKFGQVSNNLQGLGDFGTLRDYRRVVFRYGIYGFHVGLVMPHSAGWADDPAFERIANDFESVYQEISGGEGKGNLSLLRYIPGVEVAYTYVNKYIDLKLFGSFRPYISLFINAEDFKDRIEVYSANGGFGTDIKLGQAKIYFTAWYGLNQHLTGGLHQSIGMVFNVTEAEHLEMNLQHAFGGAIGFDYTFLGFITPSIGAGWTGVFTTTDKRVRNHIGVYINCKFDLSKYFSIIPEVAYQQILGGDKVSEGWIVSAGILGRVMF